jgi:multidrug efflux pump subunit AcrA (membrane-fusion protein)
MEVRAIFENKTLVLLPGLFVRVRIPVRQNEKGIYVEDTAVGTSQLGEYVLVVNKDNIVEQRTVKVGQVDGKLRVIESGLTGEEWIITNGMQRAIPGIKVEPEKKAAATATIGEAPTTSQ